MPDWDAGAETTEALRSGPEALYQLLARRLKRRPGYDLLTVLAPNEAGDRLIRLFSSDLDDYPLGEADVVKDDKWFRRLFLELEPIIANDARELASWLPDFSDPAVSARGALVNVPIVTAGVALCLLNLMSSAGSYGRDDIDAISKEGSLAALATLSSRRTPRTFEIRSTAFSSARYDKQIGRRGG